MAKKINKVSKIGVEFKTGHIVYFGGDMNALGALIDALGMGLRPLNISSPKSKRK